MLCVAWLLLARGTVAAAKPSTPRYRTTSLWVRELVCHGCSLEILKAVVHAPGFVRIVAANVTPQVVTIRYDAAATTPLRLAARIRARMGWAARPLPGK